MKALRTSLFVLFITALSVGKLFAQEGMEDVIYLKSGSIYRGVIIEQVPNVSMKIQTGGGSVFAVNISDVTKITKEQKYYDQQAHYGYGMHSWHRMDSMNRDFHPRRKGYFMQTQVLIENLQGGVRLVNGYKFGRFGYLGIGIGADFVFNAPFVRSNTPTTSSYDLRGTYLPLYIYYSGDILKKRFTPFYALEAGVAMAHRTHGNFFDGNNNMNPMGRRFEGGPMGSAGIGLKLNSTHRVHFSVLFNMNFKNVHFDETSTFIDTNGDPHTTTTKNSSWMMFPGVRLGIGF